MSKRTKTPESTESFMPETESFMLDRINQSEITVFDTINVSDIPIGKVEVKGGVRSLPTHTANPYIREVRDKQQVGFRAKNFFKDAPEGVVNKQTGEMWGTENKQVVVKQERVDRAKFVRIYVEEISRMANLPQYAWKLFQYILTNLGVKSDEVYIYSEDVMKWCGWNRPNQLQKALVCLTKKGFIAKSYKPYWWYINPSIFFNGDRAAFIQVYEVDKQTTLDLEENNNNNG